MSRITARLPEHIMAALEELRATRYQKTGVLTTINGLVTEAVYLLLHREGVAVKLPKARRAKEAET